MFVFFLSSLSISILYSPNIQESFIKFFRWLILLITTLNLAYIFKILKPNIKLISGLIVISLIADLYFSYQAYFQFLKFSDYTFEFANYLKGVTGNKNITSASFVIRLPFILYLFYVSTNNYYKIIYWFFSALTIYVIFLLSARASFISLILILILGIVYELTSKKDIISKKSLFRILIFVSIFVLPFFITKLTINENNSASIYNRISSINVEDSSTSERLRYYKHAINRVLENPIMGVGLGYWKIKSIDYDKNNLNSYIVPYHVHNDFLEITVESGIIALFLYLSIFFASAKKFFYKAFSKIAHDDEKYFALILTMSGIGFFVDSMLNFPHARPIIMVMFCFLIVFSSHYFTKTDSIDE